MPEKSFKDLVQLMARLRGEGGCPWDREQTPDSLKPYLIEEAYEVIEAIEAGADEKVREELGDLLLQVVFHAQIAAEEGRYTVWEVIREVHEKLVRRHPHVFGDVLAETSEKVLKNWEAIKQSEKGGRSVLDGVPAALPALLKAQRVQTKVGRVGVDWEAAHGALEKVQEEFEEFDQARQSGDQEKMEREFGDLLFALVSAARHLGIDAEASLRLSTSKFMERFRYIESSLSRRGLTPSQADGATLDALWEEAKRAAQRRAGLDLDE
jgi:tetrapyrrole methylase family protein/MazG family protein